MPFPDATVKRRGQNRLSDAQKQAAEDGLLPLKAAGIIEPCNKGDFATNLVIVPKKDSNGAWTGARLAVDYRPVNKITPTDHYKIPLPDEIHEAVTGCSFFSKIDLRQGFLQIPIDPSNRHLTAFWWNGEVWQYTRCPYGLKNSPVHFQRVMNRAIRDAGLAHCAKCYIDDLLIHSATFAEHLVHVEAILLMLVRNHLKAHPEKSIFGCDILEYLGHDVSEYGLSPNQVKVSAIQALPTPSGIEQLRRVLGFANFYRGYVPNFSAIAKPLTELLCKGVVWDWSAARSEAWETIKAELCRPGNALKRADPNLPYHLHTDWSKQGISAVLGQIPEGGAEALVACLSRSCNKHEANYGSSKGEMLAAVWAIRSFRHFLHGAAHPFTLYTDHHSLLWLTTSANLEGQFMRWACLIGDFDFRIVHKPGVDHLVADGPSRHPCLSTVDRTGSREEDPDPPRNKAAFTLLTQFSE